MKKSTLTLGQITATLATIVLARHGHAEKLPRVSTRKDAERELTEMGRRQAVALGEALATEPPVYDTVFASPLLRAQQTAKLAMPQHMAEPNIIAELGIPEDPQHALNVMFNELAYSSLATYFQHARADELKDWAIEALDGIVAKAEEYSAFYDRPIHLFIGGHAVCQNAILWALYQHLPKSDARGGAAADFVLNVALEYRMGEGDAIRVTLTGLKHPICEILVNPTRADAGEFPDKVIKAGEIAAEQEAPVAA